MSSQPVDHLHPVVDFAKRLTSRLDSLSRVPLMSMTPAQKREALVALAQGEAQLATLKLRLLAEAEQSEATVGSGAATAADWLASETRQVSRDAEPDLKLAGKLESHGRLSTAMAQRRGSVAQARVIVAALGRLPKTGEFA